MRSLRLTLCCLLALAVAACGKPHSAGQPSGGVAAPATALAPVAGPAAPAATASQRQEAGLAPARPDKTVVANEDGSETVEETTGDAGTHNSLLAAVASTMAATTPSAAAAPTDSPSLWQEGVSYKRLVPGQPTNAPPGQVEVLEFFWYGCPHCYHLDPALEAWRKSKPAYITFTRVPVVWSDVHRATARLFYALESMGKLDALHTQIFDEIHSKGDPLVAADPNDTATTERLQSTFVSKFGVTGDAFAKAYHSFAVDTDLQRAEQLMIRYRVESVPTFVVNGKYVTDVSMAGSPEKLIALIGDLAAQEHKR
jgi:thiol:disulfide interchange protein DsbA